MDLSTLGAAEQAQLAQLLAKLQAMPVVEKPKRKRVTETIKYLSEPQLEALLKAASVSARDYAILTVAYCRGLRASEVGALQLSDYLEKDDRLTFKRKKGSAGGEYHLTKREVRALRAWLRERGREAGPLFPSRLGKGISQQQLDLLMKRYGAKAGLPRELCHMHSLKHSCGTHLMNLGEGLDEVRDHLGHRSLKSTEVYAQFTNKRRQARDKRLRDW